jgi:ssDNA-binding Zn-finger/Zn-ribbon topoisomerase 1
VSLKDDVLRLAEMHFRDHRSGYLREMQRPHKAYRRRWIYTGPKMDRKVKGWEPEPWRHLTHEACNLCNSVKRLIDEEGDRFKLTMDREDIKPWQIENHDCVLCPNCGFAFSMMHKELEGNVPYHCLRCNYPELHETPPNPEVGRS